MYNPANDLAARRALISSGIVGLTTAILTKTMDVQVEVSLPVGVATAIALDYLVNRESDQAALQIARTAIGNFIQNELSGTPASGTKYEEQLLTGVTALLGGATIEIGRYMAFGGGPTGYLVGATSRAGTAIATTAASQLMYGVQLPGVPDLFSGLQNVPGRLAGFAAAGWGIYSRNQLSRDLARFGMFLYDRFRTAEEGGDPPVNVQDLANQHAEQILAERPPSILVDDVTSDVTSIRDLVDELPGVPSVSPGRIALFQREDGSEVALAWDNDGALGREVPVIRLSRDTLTRVSRTVSRASDPTYSDAARSHTPSERSNQSTDPSEQRLVHRATFYGLSMPSLKTYLGLGTPMFQRLTTVVREGVTYTVIGFEPTAVSYVDVWVWNPDPNAAGHHFKFSDVNFKDPDTYPAGGVTGPRPLLEVTGEDIHPGDRVWWNVHTLMTPEVQFGSEVGILIDRSEDGAISVVGMNGSSDDVSERSFMITLSYFLTAQEDPREQVVDIGRD